MKEEGGEGEEEEGGEDVGDGGDGGDGGRPSGDVLRPQRLRSRRLLADDGGWWGVEHWAREDVHVRVHGGENLCNLDIFSLLAFFAF